MKCCERKTLFRLKKEAEQAEYGVSRTEPYGLHATKSDSRLTKFLVNNIHSYVFKLIYYENIFRN